MPRAILTFKLPQERREFAITSKAMDWALAMWDLDERLRGIVKHNAADYGADERAAFDCCRDMIREILTERGISLEDIE